MLHRRTVFLLFAFLLFPTLALAAEKSRTSPAFSLPTRDGAVISDSLRGRVVLVDFWASWCAPCAKSFPWLASMHERYGAKGLTVVAVNLDKERKQADRFLANHPASFTIAFDPQGKTAEAFQVRGMPSSFLIAPTGEIVSAHVGFDSKHAAALEARIREACTP